MSPVRTVVIRANDIAAGVEQEQERIEAARTGTHVNRDQIVRLPLERIGLIRLSDCVIVPVTDDADLDRRRRSDNLCSVSGQFIVDDTAQTGQFARAITA